MESIFQKAAMRLTLQYTAILAVGMFVFCTVIYIYMQKTFGVDYVQNYQNVAIDQQQLAAIQEVATAGLTQLREGLFTFSGVLLIVIPLLSYIMAHRALRPVRDSYEQQEAFTDNASHELRTPLAVIQGELELALQRPRSPKEYVAAIQQSLDETRALTNLANQLLFLSRGDAASARKSFEVLSIAYITQTAMQRLNLSEAQTNRITIVVPQKLTIYANAELLTQAIGNVIGNAVKFTAKTDKITVSAQSVNGGVKLVVRDTGKGMTKQELAHVFDRFWRAERSRSTAGHGLGLPIVRQIVRLHGGTIDIHSSKPSGTVVTMGFGKQGA